MSIPTNAIKRIIIERGRLITRTDVSNQVVILCYHSIHPSKPFASASPIQFERQLRWLSTTSHVVPFSRVRDIQSREKKHKPVVSITFDDGYADNYEYAAPLLAKYNIPATFFLSTGLLEKDPDVLEQFQARRMASYQDIRPLKWTDVLDMRRAGFEFGDHTYRHTNLADLTFVDAGEEIRRSKDILEQYLGEEMRLMSYPYGNPRYHFTDQTIEIVSSLGYTLAASLTERAVRPNDSPWALPRFVVSRENTQIPSSRHDLGADILPFIRKKSTV